MGIALAERNCITPAEVDRRECAPHVAGFVAELWVVYPGAKEPFSTIPPTNGLRVHANDARGVVFTCGDIRDDLADIYLRQSVAHFCEFVAIH